MNDERNYFLFAKVLIFLLFAALLGPKFDLFFVTNVALDPLGGEPI